MRTKIFRIVCALALFALPFSVYAVENITASLINNLSAGFYQFNNLEILKGPGVDEAPATIEAIQKNDPSCVIYENGKTDQPLSCVFNGEQNNDYIIQIDEKTTLLGVNQESASLSDFVAGDKINALGWLAADSKTIRAAVLRDLTDKDYHESFSGTISKVSSDGFTLTLDNGDKIFIQTPIVEGAQVTVKGVFDKINNAVSNVLSIFIKANPVLQTTPQPQAAPQSAPTPSAAPSTLFKNFLKIFGL